MNDWNEKLSYSLGENQRFDMALLKEAIPGCVSVVKTNPDVDKSGIDYIATLRRGATINIDAKTRTKEAAKFWRGEAELALEIYSVCPGANGLGGKTGWTLNEASNVDYILFTFAEGTWGKFYLIPFQLLRMAFIKNFKEWSRMYHRKKQRSNNWMSEAMFVPASVVLKAVSEQMEKQVI